MPRNSSEFTRRGLLKTALFGGASAWIGNATALASTDQGEQAVAAPAVKPRGIVFMVADGMSPGVMTLAEAYSRLTRQRGTRWWQLYSEPGAARGLMDTASASSLVTDSSAASSAWGGGKRIRNGVVNIDPDGRELTPIAALLKSKSNARIGLVTTASVTHATPAGFASVSPSRDDEPLIAPQYLDRVDVVLGGGSAFFDGKRRKDKRDLKGDFEKSGYRVIGHRDELMAAGEPKLLGTFKSGHLPFEIDRLHDEALARRIPTLKEMAMAALDRFLNQDRPFLLQVEGGRVDHAAHLNDIAGLLGEQLAFDDTVAAVLSALQGRNDILVVVTSDHGNSNPGLRGIGSAYGDSTRAFEMVRRAKASHEAVFAEWKAAKDRSTPALAALIETKLGIALKSDESEALAAVLSNQKVTEWNHLLDNPEGLLGQFCGNHTGIGWVGTTHTSDPTLISAVGPQAQRFSGMVVNSDVYGHLAELLG